MHPGIVALEFGVDWTIRSNRIIGQIASKKARELNAPIYAQLNVRLESGAQVTWAPGEDPTLRVVRGAVQWALQRGIDEVWIVAARPHLRRTLRDMREAIHECGAQIDVHICSDVYSHPKDIWFCSDSAQWRTRTSEAWQRRDWVLMQLPFFLYKRVAS